jgi:hypothetical protein
MKATKLDDAVMTVAIAISVILAIVGIALLSARLWPW